MSELSETFKDASFEMACGEQGASPVIFKQLLKSDAIGYCQIDAVRVAGVNDVMAIILMAAKYGKPVCPHGGGIARALLNLMESHHPNLENYLMFLGVDNDPFYYENGSVIFSSIDVNHRQVGYRAAQLISRHYREVGAAATCIEIPPFASCRPLSSSSALAEPAPCYFSGISENYLRVC